MTRFRLCAPSPATLIASLALFLALSGTVYAGVRIAKNSIGTGEIKNKSVRGADLADDTVTGAQIDESTLAAVPRAATAGTAGSATSAATAGSAKNADRSTTSATADRAAYADRAGTADKASSATSAGTAGSATTAGSAVTAGSADRAATAADADHAATSDKVGGHPASDFTSASTTFPVAVRLAAGGKVMLVARDGIRLEARCSTGVMPSSGTTPLSVLDVVASSTVAGATLDSPNADFDGESAANSIGPSTAPYKSIAYSLSTNQGTKREEVPAEGIVFTSVGGTTIFFGTGGGIRAAVGLNGADCSVSAPVVVAAP